MAAAGQAELSSRALTLEAMTGMLDAVAAGRGAPQALDELGAVERDLARVGLLAAG